MSQRVLFTVCAMNELFFIALYLLSFSSLLLMPSFGSSKVNFAKASQIWRPPWSAGAMEMARYVQLDYVRSLRTLVLTSNLVLIK